MAKRDTFSNVVRTFLDEAEGGPYTISDLARMLGIPRSTVYRHLRGGQPTRESLKSYAKVLRIGEDELARLAGYAAPSPTGIPEQIQTLSVEIAKLDQESIDAIWRIVLALRRNCRSCEESQDPQSVAPNGTH